MKLKLIDEFNFCPADGEMAERLRAFDWQSTTLGPPSAWPQSLRLVLGVCFASHFPIAVWWGPDLIQFYNDGYRPILGAMKHPSAFGAAAQGTWPEIWPTIGPMVDNVMNQGQAVKGDDMVLVLERNGYPEHCNFTFSYSPVRDTDGAIVAMFTAAVETTERVQAERRQAFQLNLADRLRGLGAPDDITGAATALLGEYLQVSRSFYSEIDDEASTFSIPAKWIAASGLPDLPLSGPVDTYSPALLSALRTGTPFIVQDTHKDERIAPYAALYESLRIRSIVVMPLLRSGRLLSNFNVADTTPRHWTPEDISIVADVAERTWDAVERARAEHALRLADQRKDEFLAMLAHELRNPLAPISTAAHVLALPTASEAMVRHASGVINRQVRHMTALVDDLLDVSRVTQGRVELQTEILDLKLVVASAVEQAQPLIEARGHALVLRLGSAPALVMGDKTRLIQVLSNLLNNAAKYTPNHGEIVLGLEVREGQAHFYVSDNGSGMAPGLVPHVFELFTQAERTPDRAQGGLGLGLALVKHIIALHAGAVGARSEGLGKGSLFTVTLPLAG